MSGAQKKRAFDNNPENVENGSSGSDSDDDVQTVAYAGNEEIQVEFEGRNPIDSDFHGIKQLLQQLFLKAHLNLSELAELIIGQNYVGSVVKQSTSEDEDDDGEDDEMSDINEVFGVTSVINITKKHNVECVQQLRNLLVDLAEKHGTDSTVKLIKDILGNDSKQTGILINERFINIPAQIAVPLLENLYTEIQRAINRKMPFDFSYYILICKLYKKDGNEKKKNKNEPEIIWSNQEEEVLLPEALASFEFSVKDETDSAMDGNWLESDAKMTPYRKILVFDASSLPRIIETVKNYVSQV